MKRRTKIYLAKKRVERYLKTPMGSFVSTLNDDLLWYGMAGTRTYLDESGNVKVDRLSFGALNEIREASNRGEFISNEYTIQLNNPIPYYMKEEVDNLRDNFKNK